MKIKILDKVLEQYDLDMNKEYEVIRTETVRDDEYYVVTNDKGEEFGVIDLLAEVIR